MLFYYFVYSMIPIFYVVSNLFFNYKKIVFFILTNIFLISIISFRGLQVGTDTNTYFSISNWVETSNLNILDLSNNSGIEPLYLLLNRYINVLSGSTQFIIPVVSAITVLLFSFLIYEYSDNYFLSYVIYLGFCYYFLSFNISRQFLATSICWLSSFFLIKKKDKISLSLIIIAFFVHRSSIIFLIVWLFMKVSLTKKSFKFLMIFSGISFLISYKIPYIFLNKFPRYSNLLSGNVKVSNGPLQIIFIISLFILFLFLYRNFNFISSTKLEAFYLYVMFLICGVDGLSIFIPFLGRIKYVFEPFLILIIPYIVNLSLNKRDRIIISIFVFAFGFIIMPSLIINNDFYGIIPYSWDFGFYFN